MQQLLVHAERTPEDCQVGIHTVPRGTCSAAGFRHLRAPQAVCARPRYEALQLDTAGTVSDDQIRRHVGEQTSGSGLQGTAALVGSACALFPLLIS